MIGKWRVIVSAGPWVHHDAAFFTSAQQVRAWVREARRVFGYEDLGHPVEIEIRSR